MAHYSVGFEGGTLGNAITTTAGDASPAFDAVSGSQIVFDNTHVRRGSMAAKVPSTSSGTLRFRWNNGTRYSYTRTYFYIDSYPTSDTILTWTADTGAGTASSRGYINVANKLRIGSKTSTNIATATPSYPLNQFVRQEHYADAGTSSADGKVRVAYYLGNSLTPEYDSGLLTTNVADSTGIIDEVRFLTASFGANIWMDSADVDTGTDAQTRYAAGFGTWIDTSPPTLTLTPAQNLANGVTATFQAFPTDDGSIVSYAWSVVTASSTASPALTGASTDTVTFTTPALGNLVTLQCTVMDNDGLTATTTTELRTPLGGSTTGDPLAIDGQRLAGTFTKVGAAATDGATLATALDTDYLETATLTATAQTFRFRWQPRAIGSAASMNPIRLGTDTGTGNVIVKLYEGNTLRKTFGAQAVTSTPTDYSFVIDSTTIGTIGDWSNLWAEVNYTS